MIIAAATRPMTMPGTKPAANEPPEKLFEDCLESIRSAGVEAASLAGVVVDGTLTEIDAVEVGRSDDPDCVEVATSLAVNAMQLPPWHLYPIGQHALPHVSS